MELGESSKRRSALDVVQYFLILAPIVINLRYILKYSLNIPRYDDYDSILEFVYNFKKTAFPANLTLLFKQHIEHRIFTTRLLAATYYYIFGEINFKGFILLNFIITIIFFLVLVALIRKIIPSYWKWAAVVLSLCLFDLINCDISNWAMSGPQNYGVTLFFIGSIMLYSRGTLKYAMPAIALQILCIYTSGNGHIGSLFIVAYTILSKNKLNIVLSSLTMMVFSSLYYYHYHSAASTFTSDLSKVIPFFLHTVGSHFSLECGIFASVVMLAFTVILFPATSFNIFKIDHKVLPLVCIAGYLLGSLVVLSFFRGGLPAACAYSSRYIIYSHLLLVILFVWLLYKIERDNLSVLLCVKDNRHSLPLIAPILVMVIISYFFNFLDGREGFTSMYKTLTTEQYYFPDPVKAKTICENACKSGIYCIESHRVENK